MIPTSDLHVVETRPLVAPALLHRELPLSDAAAATVREARKTATREMVETSLIEHLSDLITQSTRNTGVEPGIDAATEARRIAGEHFG